MCVCVGGVVVDFVLGNVQRSEPKSQRVAVHNNAEISACQNFLLENPY